MKYPSALVALALIATLPASAIAYRLLPDESLIEVVQVRALRYGDTGEAVAALQELLLSRGFDPGPVDGIFGPLTEAAVRAAQRHFELEVDGLAGRLTIGALRAQAPSANQVPSGPEAAADLGRAADSAVGDGQDGSASTRGVPGGAAADATRTGAAERGATPGATGSEAAAGGPAGGSAGHGAASGPQGPAPVRAESGLLIYRADAVDRSGQAAAPRGEVALTFHHLPEPAALDALLTLLEGAAVHATFFVTGEEALSRPSDLRRILTAGHAVGSLGYRTVDMRRMSPEDARAELRRARQAVLDAAGEAPELFRPPLGRFDRQLVALVEEEGMQFLLWSNAALFIEPGTEPERLAELAGRALYPGAVLMLPLDEPAGAEAVAPLLDRTRDAGYRVVPLAEIRPAKGLALSTRDAR